VTHVFIVVGKMAAHQFSKPKYPIARRDTEMAHWTDFRHTQCNQTTVQKEVMSYFFQYFSFHFQFL